MLLLFEEPEEPEEFRTSGFKDICPNKDVANPGSLNGAPAILAEGIGT